MTQPPHIMIVQSRFYDHIADLLLAGAAQALDSAGAPYQIWTVPGALEIPQAIKIGMDHFDGFVALGCVIRGETTHYETVCHDSSGALMDMSMRHGALIGNGILTCETQDQAILRADPKQKNKGAGAAQAVLALLNIKNSIQNQQD